MPTQGGFAEFFVSHTTACLPVDLTRGATLRDPRHIVAAQPLGPLQPHTAPSRQPTSLVAPYAPASMIACFARSLASRPVGSARLILQGSLRAPAPTGTVLHAVAKLGDVVGKTVAVVGQGQQRMRRKGRGRDRMLSPGKSRRSVFPSHVTLRFLLAGARQARMGCSSPVCCRTSAPGPPHVTRPRQKGGGRGPVARGRQHTRDVTPRPDCNRWLAVALGQTLRSRADPPFFLVRRKCCGVRIVRTHQAGHRPRLAPRATRCVADHACNPHRARRSRRSRGCAGGRRACS